jgi:hypothetical protein
MRVIALEQGCRHTSDALGHIGLDKTMPGWRLAGLQSLGSHIQSRM